MSIEKTCPNCGSLGMQRFYEAENVPIHSCVLLLKKEEALDFPCGKIVLGFCKNCGFISNLVFEPSLLDYSNNYEDQQCFSPSFNSFAQSLAHRLVDKYDLKGKEVLEIGCGKGDFLTLLCRLGNNRGVGIDPAIINERINDDISEQVVFVKDYYSENYSEYHGDLICCRHTLEHIQNTSEFMAILRRSIGKRLDTIVFFEVPDVDRILNDVAFWDIYYEHCSYFSPRSLAELFRLCKFEVIEISREFGDQYLIIEAKPVKESSDIIHDLEESVEKIEKDVICFSINCNKKMDDWKERIEQINTDGLRSVIWGSGSKCVSFMTTLSVKDEIGYVIDINPYRQGKFLPGLGKKIMPPEFIREYKPDVTMVMNPVYKDEIAEMIEDIGVNTEIILVE